MVLKTQHEIFTYLCKLLSSRSSLTLVSLLKQSFHFLLWGGLLLLHQVSMAFSDTPAIGFWQRGAEGTTRSRFQLLPVVTASPTVWRVRIYAFYHMRYMKNEEWWSIPGSDPRLRVNLQTAAPVAVFLWASRIKTPLSLQLLRQGTDVIGFKSAAATDVTDTSVIGLPGIFLHVPSGQYPGLQTCQKEYWWNNILPVYKSELESLGACLLKGNSGRSMKPWQLQSGVWKASGWDM